MKLQSFFKYFLVLIFFYSCTHEPVHITELEFAKPVTFTEKVLYQTAKNMTFSHINHEFAPDTTRLLGIKKWKDIACDFLIDLGAAPISIETQEGKIQGFYFDPHTFQKCSIAAYKKWKTAYKNPKLAKLAQICEINFESHHLISLLGLPPSLYLMNSLKKAPHAALLLPSFDFSYEFDPRWIATYLARGFHLLVISSDYGKSSKLHFDWEARCLAAHAAFNWLKTKLGVDNRDITIVGKGLGTGPAIYTAVMAKGSNLVLEEAFIRLSDSLNLNAMTGFLKIFKPLARWTVENFYRFPNEDWIKRVQGKILCIESYSDTHSPFEIQHAVKMRVNGGYYSPYWTGSHESWYSEELSQERLNKFFTDVYGK